ncbi:MAG: ABC transporter substrate-binding protein [Prevotella sp.]|nr:ABC transporter substrate-binding protein [Prevotella sp.]
MGCTLRNKTSSFILPIVLCTLLMLTSCAGNGMRPADESGDTIRFRYAENIEIVRYAHHIVVKMKNPWRKGTLHTYILTDEGKEKDWDVEGTIVRTPLKRSVVFNTAHASLLCMLGEADRIKGVCDLKYMNIPEIHRRLLSSAGSEPSLIDCGNSMSPDIETIIDLGADGILLSPFENSGGYGKVEELGIPIIECADYMETSALGRAEWMRFYGILYGCEAKADSLFNMVEESYLQWKEKARQSQVSRSIITERMTGSTWYVAGGRSSVGKLIADANGKFAWANDTHSGSLALPFETVLDKAGDADVWIFNDGSPVPMTYGRLSSEHHGYTSMKAFRDHHVYVVRSMETPYFEEVSFRPDRLLRDYIIMLHPDLNIGELTYFKPL